MSSTSLRITAICTGLAFGLVAAAADPIHYCTKRELRAKETTTIQLEPGIRDRPAFYLRESAPERVMFFRPGDVLALVDKWDANGRQDFKQAIDQLRADLPLKEDTDFFKYALRDAHFGGMIDYLVAELLGAGKAAIDFQPFHMPGGEAVQPNDQFDPTTIKRVYWETRGGNGHKFCDPQGYGIHFIVETIID